MKFIFASLISVVSMSSFANDCVNLETTMTIESSYICKTEDNSKNVCVNYGDFIFEEKKILRVFNPGGNNYDLAFFLDTTDFGKCIWGIASCEAIKDDETSLQARRKIVPTALLKESDIRFKLDKEKLTALINRSYFDEEGDLSSTENLEFKDCKKIR